MTRISTIMRYFPLSVDILNQINHLQAPAMDEMAELGKELPRKEKWTQADECYYLLLREEVQGVPFFPNEFWPVNGVGNSVSPPLGGGHRIRKWI